MGKKYRLIFYKIVELLQFACIWACFDVVGQACTTFCRHNAAKRELKTSKYLKRVGNIAYLSTKSKNYCNLRVPELDSTKENPCTMFRKHNAVQSAFKSRNISNGRDISLNFLQNRRIIAICVYLGLFRRWRTGVYYVLHA